MQNIFVVFLLAIIYSATSVSKQKTISSQSKIDSVNEIEEITLNGVLNKKITVGYRNPYLLITQDGVKFEIRGSNFVNRDELEKHIGRKVELTGRQVVIPSSKALPGSEAESRFVRGIIPQIKYIETTSIRRL